MACTGSERFATNTGGKEPSEVYEIETENIENSTIIQSTELSNQAVKAEVPEPSERKEPETPEIKEIETTEIKEIELTDQNKPQEELNTTQPQIKDKGNKPQTETDTAQPQEEPAKEEPAKQPETPKITPDKHTYTPKKVPTETVEVSENNFHVKSPYAGIYGPDMQVIYSKNAQVKISIASTTKIITAATALTYMSPDELITVGNELKLVQPGSSLANIRPGQVMTLKHALICLLLPSGNDAAYTVAYNVGKKVMNNPEATYKETVDYFL